MFLWFPWLDDVRLVAFCSCCSSRIIKSFNLRYWKTFNLRQVAADSIEWEEPPCCSQYFAKGLHLEAQFPVEKNSWRSSTWYRMVRKGCPSHNAYWIETLSDRVRDVFGRILGYFSINFYFYCLNGNFENSGQINSQVRQRSNYSTAFIAQITQIRTNS